MVLDPMAAFSSKPADDLRPLLDASDAGIIRLDRSGCCTFVNRAAGQLLGCPPEMLLGQPLHARVHQHTSDHASEPGACRLDRALREGLALQVDDDRFRRADGSSVAVEYQLDPIFDGGQQTGLALLFRDRGERREREQRRARTLRLLRLRGEIAATLGSRATIGDMLRECAGAFVMQFDAAFARIWLYDPARHSLVLSASAGQPSGEPGRRGVVPFGAFNIGRIAETREPYLTNDVAHDPRINGSAWAEREGVSCFAGYPLLDGDRLIGVLALFTREPVVGDLFEELAAIATLIAEGIERRREEIENRRLVEHLQAQQARLRTILQQMPSGILIAETPSGRIVLGNDQVERILGQPIQQATSLDDVHPRTASHANGRPLAPGDWPLARAVRGGEVTHEEEMAYRRTDGANRWISVSAAPVRDNDGRIVAAVEIIDDIDGRKRSEERLRLLLQVSELLAGTLDLDLTLAQVANLTVPLVADWCFVDLLQEPGFRRVAVAHVGKDAARGRLAARLRRVYGPVPDGDHGILRVAQSGRPDLVTEIDDDLLQRLARDESHLESLRAMGLVSFLSVPLAARGRTLGVLTLSSADSGRRFSEADIPFAEDLARRAAAAIDNARLDLEARQHLDRLNALVEVSKQVAEAGLDLPQTLQVVAEQAARRIGDGCTIRLLDANGEMLERWASFHVDPAVRIRLQQVTGTPLPLHGGLHEPVVRDGQALLAPDIDESHFAAVDNDYQPYAEFAGLHSLLMVPMRVHERVIGTLALTRDRTGLAYTVDDQVLAQELADRAALAVDNARLYHETQEAVTAREEFLSIAAHELKTPLTTIKGYGQMLQRQLRRRKLEPEALQRSAATLLEQLGRLEGLVTDLLDVSRIQQGQLAFRPEPCDLAEIAAQVVARFEQTRQRQPRHQLSLDAPVPVAGTWDPVRLDQVLTNLISNAVKYSPRGGEIEVCVRAEDGRALLSVRDAGLGIPLDQQARLFQPFARVQSQREGVSGTGLGLYICRQIVERHGGAIEVNSAPGQGSTFSVTLPR